METFETYIVISCTLVMGVVLVTTLKELFDRTKESESSGSKNNVVDMELYIKKKALKYHIAANVNTNLVEKTILLRRKDETLKRLSGE